MEKPCVEGLGSIRPNFRMMEDGTLDFDPELEDLARLASLNQGKGWKPAIPGYELECLLGEGSFGEVWSGVQLSTGQRVAIKTLHRTDLGSVTYLQNEVSRLAGLGDHPNVLSLLDANLQNRPAFLVTPLLQSSLEAYVSSQVAVEQVSDWMEQVADALSYIHGRGILHCDLKPSNLLLDNQNRVRVVDFGQAHLLDDAGGKLGTLWFMPPEQIPIPGYRPIPEVSWDLYAWGATAYALLTGRIPRQTQEGQESIRSLHQPSQQLERYRRLLGSSRLEPVRSLNPRVDRDFAAIVERALDLNAEVRYRSAVEILAEFSRRRRRVPVRARPATPGYVGRRFILRNWAVCLLFVSGSAALAWTGKQMVHHRARELVFHARAQTAQARVLADQGSLRSLLMLARAVATDPTDWTSRLHFSALSASHLQASQQFVGPFRQSALAKGLLLWFPSEGLPRIGGYASEHWSPVVTREFDEPLRRFDVSEDGRWLVVLGDRGVMVFDLSRESADLRQLPVKLRTDQPSAVLAASVDAESKSLVVGRQDGKVVWDGPHQDLSWNHKAPARHVVLGSDGLWAASGGDDGVVEVRDLTTGQSLLRWEGSSPVIGLCRTSQPREVLVGLSDGRLSLLAPGRPERPWQTGVSLQGLRSVPSGALLAWGGKVCRVYGADGARLLEVASTAEVTCADLSQDGKHLLTGHADGTVQLWNGRNGQPAALPINRQIRVREVGFVTGKQEFFMNSSVLEIWSYKDVVPPPGPIATGQAQSLVWGASGQWLATSSNGKVTAWSREGLPLCPPFSAGRGLVFAPPSGALVISGFRAGERFLESWFFQENGPKRLYGRALGGLSSIESSQNQAYLCLARKDVVEVVALDSGKVAWSGKVEGEMLRALPADDGKSVAAVIKRANQLHLALISSDRPPLLTPVSKRPLGLHITQAGVFFGDTRQCTLYDFQLKQIWSLEYPVPAVVAGADQDPLDPQWRDFLLDPTGRTVVCVAVQQVLWLDLKSGSVLRHIWEGRTQSGALSADGAFLCLFGGQGATLHRLDSESSTAVPFSFSHIYRRACFRPDGRALALSFDEAVGIYPLELDLDSPPSDFLRIAEQKTGRILENNQMYRLARTFQKSVPQR